MTGSNFIGLDIGGTHISAVVASNKLKIISKRIIKTPNSKIKFIKIVNHLVSKLDSKSTFIGIAVAGIISGSKLKKAPNIPFLKNFSFQDVFGKQNKIVLDNDARNFLKGELNLIEVPEKLKTIGLTIGTGIGRSVASGKNIKKIKKLEYPVKWEGQYQKARDSKNYRELIVILAIGLIPIIKKYKPDNIILGGGVVLNKKNKVTTPLIKIIKKMFPKTNVRIAKLGPIAGAYGSAINAKEYLKR